MVMKPPAKKKAEALIIGFEDTEDVVIAPAKNPFAKRPVLGKNRPAASSVSATKESRGNAGVSTKDKRLTMKG